MAEKDEAPIHQANVVEKGEADAHHHHTHAEDVQIARHADDARLAELGYKVGSEAK